ncbi:MAG: AbrB/MazE/SpoVT family DNA-binding domain-containing protein [Pseudomonadales bacterium]|jgi:AbrB family looped-hinge helix DNA binding protein|nr:AbrB/MazE/SpoVT family DNA-binding domain-containing protein [Pseudomonadales bacterium]
MKQVMRATWQWLAVAPFCEYDFLNFQLFREGEMPLVTVKPKFQVTLPARLRRQIAVQEGDMLDAVLVPEGILLRPKAVMDKQAAVSRLQALFAQSPQDSREESAVMAEAIDEVAAHRAGR